jgi:hypothetical protein
MKRALLALAALGLLAAAVSFARDTGQGRRVESRVTQRLTDPVPLPAAGPAAPNTLELQTLAPGFEYGAYHLPTPSPLGDSMLRFVRVDPAKVDLEVRAASLVDKRLKTASEWAADAPVVAVINTSMFRDDWLTSVGYLRVHGTVQNGAWASQQNALLAFDGSGPDTLLDLACGDREAALATYPTLVQSIRMVGCDGKNVWAQEKRAWSSAIVGLDKQGRLLFLHVRSPYTMHDLVDQLLASPLEITRLHYGEGGPEASLFVRGPGVDVRNIGSFETGFEENDDNREEWQLPNVIVATPR